MVMSKKEIVVVVGLLVFCFGAARNVSAQAQPNAERMAAAADVLKAMNMDAAFFNSAQEQSGELLGQLPNVAEMRAVMKEFTGKYLPPSKLQAEMARLYAAAFTTKELRELAVFYRTPLGRKTARVQPQISTDFAKFTQAETMKHLPELQQMMMQKMNK